MRTQRRDTFQGNVGQGQYLVGLPFRRTGIPSMKKLIKMINLQATHMVVGEYI